MGNRLDQFKWDGTSLVYEKTLHRGRAFQDDLTNRTNPANPVFRGNHNGGVVRVGPDGKIYLQVGDTGRRGQTQNLFDGPFGEGIPDDQFGGPDITNDHLTGVILRLNTDGTAPRDNPFWKVGAERGGQVGANLKKIFAYGLRNGFGMAFDPFSGDLWEQENGDDSFSEINRVQPGFNSGWTQVMGPLDRVAQYKAIETNRGPTGDPAAGSYYGLQQNRWLPENIADNPRDAERALFKLPGSKFSDPEMSWKYEFAPGGIGFVSDRALGKDYRGDMFIGSASGLRREPVPPADPQQPQGDRSRRQPPARRRRGQPAQVRPDRERDAALRLQLRRHARGQGEPDRLADRRIVLAGDGLRDPQEGQLARSLPSPHCIRCGG